MFTNACFYDGWSNKRVKKCLMSKYAPPTLSPSYIVKNGGLGGFKGLDSESAEDVDPAECFVNGSNDEMACLQECDHKQQW